MRFAWILVLAGCGFQAAPVEPSETGVGQDGGFQFDITTCPASYTTVLPGLTATSRYRLIVTGGAPGAQIDACNADMPGKSHLVVISSIAEAQAVSALVNDTTLTPPIARNEVWIGAVQAPLQTAALDGWINFDDTPVDPGLWTAGEPNDGGNEANHDEQFGSIERGKHYLADTKASEQLGALCECDGVPVGTMASAFIAASR